MTNNFAMHAQGEVAPCPQASELRPQRRGYWPGRHPVDLEQIKMTMKKHMLTLALATSMAATASVAAMAQSADKLDNQNAVTAPGKPNSGPGVKGAPDTRTGPATRAPDGTSGTAGEGTSSGEAGATTTPSQDSSGVEGMPGNKSGPAAKQPSGSSAQ
jgi:hypothetical protein